MKKEIRYNRNKKNNPDTANVIGDGPPPNSRTMISQDYIIFMILRLTKLTI